MLGTHAAYENSVCCEVLTASKRYWDNMKIGNVAYKVQFQLLSHNMYNLIEVTQLLMLEIWNTMLEVK